MSIIGLCRHCPICDKLALGNIVTYNKVVYHSRCFSNRLIQREYYNELSNREHLSATLHYLDLV